MVVAAVPPTSPLGSDVTAAFNGQDKSDGRFKVAHHPRLAAEVVRGEERVDARDPTKVKADDEVPEILAGHHAVGMLADQDEVWLE